MTELAPTAGRLRSFLTCALMLLATLGLYAWIRSGPRTRIARLDSPADWLACGAIVVVATLVKLGGTALAGLITPKLFTMMVVMALVTTFLTAPVLDRVLGKRGFEAV